MKNKMYKAIPAVYITVEENNISLLSYGFVFVIGEFEPQ